MLEIIFTSPWYWIMGAAVLISFLCIPIGIWLWTGMFGRYDGGGDIEFTGGTTTIIGSVLFLMFGGIYFGGMLPPYDTSFYHTYKITGELTTIEAAFSGDEGTMSQVFILEVEGIEYPIKSEDQRFRLMDEGDQVDLVCGKSFAYFQEPWFDCTVRKMVR